MRSAVNGLGSHPVESSNLSLINPPLFLRLIAYKVKHVAHNYKVVGSNPSQPNVIITVF